MTINSPADLLAHEMGLIVDAETQASEALRGLTGTLSDAELGRLLERRLMQGEEVLDGVRESLKQLGRGQDGVKNTVATALIQQGRELLDEVNGPELKRVVAIAAVQKLEHYCIAAWGTVRALAEEAGQEYLAELMTRALDEGKTLDADLTDLAEGQVNPGAIERAVGAPKERRSFHETGRDG
jgi:ferritin-like metal-binding protein YciE